MPNLALNGAPPTRTQPYPDWPVWDERDVAAVTGVVKSGRWGGFPEPGPQAAELGRRFAAMHDAKHGIVMMNGTVTMEVACRAAGIGWGDEVLIPAYTFQATAAAPMAAGAIPVIVDIDPENYCLDPIAVEKSITERTRGIIPVHLGQNMADLDAIVALAEKYNLVVIEDCAHAHGAKWRGKGAGSIGHFGSFSLQSSKTLTSGEGGILLTNSDKYAERAHSLIDCGRPKDPDESRFTMGANYRISELQAALALVGLERFPEQAKEREEMAAYMDEALSEVPGVSPLRRDPRHTVRSFYRYIFKIDPAFFGGLDHRAVVWALDAEGISCWVGYESMSHYDLFQPRLSKLPVPSAFADRFDFSRLKLPAADQACDVEAVWLDEAIFRAGRDGVDDVISALLKVQANLDELKETAERALGRG